MTTSKATAEQVRRVLREVRQNGRVSYTSVAERVGIPRQLVASIVNEALAENRIRITATINPDLLGITRYSYVRMSISGPSEPILAALEAIPELCLISALAGTFGVDCEIRASSDENHQDVLNRIRSIPGVSALSCNIYERIVVNIDSPLPEPGVAPLKIDRVDQSILRELERDGRATFRELGAAAGISAASARNRLQRLLHHKVVRIVGLPVRDHQVGPPPLGLGLRVRGDVSAVFDDVIAVEPEYLAVSSGSFDLIATISADSHEGLLAKLDALRGIERITAVEAWSHLKITREQYGLGGLTVST